MNAKAYLSQGLYLDDCINENILELESLKSDICRSTPRYKDIPGTHNASTDIKLSTYIDKSNRLKKLIDNETDLLVSHKAEIRGKIMLISNPKLRLVLLKRYFRLLKWKQIQKEMRYEELKSVYRVHDKALEEFIKIHGNNFEMTLNDTMFI